MFEYNGTMKWLEVDVISLLDKRHIPMPMRIRFMTKNGARAVDIDKIVSYESKIAAGEPYIRYQCRAVNQDDQAVSFMMQYWVSDCLWQMSMTE